LEGGHEGGLADGRNMEEAIQMLLAAFRTPPFAASYRHSNGGVPFMSTKAIGKNQ
jgi:hypothetical protein